MRQISPLFAHFATVMAFAEESTFVSGQVVQALGAALRSHVKNYMVRPATPWWEGGCWLVGGGCWLVGGGIKARVDYVE